MEPGEEFCASKPRKGPASSAAAERVAGKQSLSGALVGSIPSPFHHVISSPRPQGCHM